MAHQIEKYPQVASRQRLEFAIDSGLDARTVLRLILDDKWGVEHLISGLGGNLATDGRTSFTRFCVAKRRFDVFQAVFESSEVAARLAPDRPIDVLMKRMVMVERAGEQVRDAEPLGMSLLQIGARHFCPQMVDYALRNQEASIRYEFSEGDVYAAGMLALMSGLNNEDIRGSVDHDSDARECSRLLLAHDPPRGRSKDCMATVILVSGAPRPELQEVSRSIILDHFRAGKIDPGFTRLDNSGSPVPLIEEAIDSLHAPLARALADFRYQDPELEAQLQACAWKDQRKSLLTHECITLIRALKMKDEIQMQSQTRVGRLADTPAANVNEAPRRRLRLV